MANANTSFGLMPVRDTSGRLWTGAANLYFVASSLATGVFIGDPMIPTGTSDANGVPGVTLATAGSGNYTIGPMVSIANGGEPIVPITRDLPIYRPASTGQYIMIADDPNLMFKIQEDSVSGNVSVNDSMANANLVAGTGSTATGYSGWQLQSSSVGTGNTIQLRILQLLREADNAAGASAKWMVKINLHSLSNLTGI